MPDHETPDSLRHARSRVYTRPTLSKWALDRTPNGVAVHGEIDLDAAGSFTDQLLDASTQGTGDEFQIDLSDVTFLASAGVAALMGAIQVLDGKHVVIQTSKQVYAVLDMVGLTDGSVPTVEVRPPPAEPTRR
jgi:anti-anti-sigma factor